MTSIYLIRHAEAEGNLYRIAQGQYNSIITDRGWRQIRALEEAGCQIVRLAVPDREAARAIRALPDPQLSRIPILALTANAFESDRKNALAAGMNGHISKPIQPDRLYDAIRDVFSRR